MDNQKILISIPTETSGTMEHLPFVWKQQVGIGCLLRYKLSCQTGLVKNQSEWSVPYGRWAFADGQAIEIRAKTDPGENGLTNGRDFPFISGG